MAMAEGLCSDRRFGARNSVSCSLHLSNAPNSIGESSMAMDEIAQEPPAQSSGALAVINERTARTPFRRSQSANRAIGIPKKKSSARMLKSSSLPAVSELARSPFTTMLEGSSPESDESTATIPLLGSPAGSSPTRALNSWSIRLLRIPSQSEVNDMIDRENRNTAEYTSLDSLIKYTQNDDFGSPPNFGSPRPPLKDSIVEKTCRLYLRASESMKERRREGFGCALMREVWRLVGAVLPIQCITGTSIANQYDADYY